MRHLPSLLAAVSLTLLTAAAEDAAPSAAVIDGTGPGWRALKEADFVNVNCHTNTWTFREDGVIACTGKPTGVIRTKQAFTNLELVVEWRHLKPAGNSGLFLWTIPASLERLKGPGLPHGIEVQVLDVQFGEHYTRRTGKPATWFTSHGDVFPVGAAKMKPFPPLSPNGSRSFPSEDRVKNTGEWNHYYVRAINGEVRLWVNGKEVSGGSGCAPATGPLCLESEGSPIEFRHLRVRELP